MLRVALLLVFFLTLPCASAWAQKYITAAGARFQTERVGLTVQQLLVKSTTAEVIGMFSREETSGTALAEQHFKLLGRRLNVYLGAGGHYGAYQDSLRSAGLDALIGIEYKVNGLPVLLSFDFKPAYHFDLEDQYTFPTAFSARFVFIKEKKGGFFRKIFKKDEDE